MKRGLGVFFAHHPFGAPGFFLRSRAFSLISCASFAALACTHYVGRGSDLYYQGRYIGAAHVLEMSEQRLREAEPEDRVAYGLYRGATLFRLGDLDGARRWLEYSERIAAANPKLLRVD